MPPTCPRARSRTRPDATKEVVTLAQELERLELSGDSSSSSVARELAETDPSLTEALVRAEELLQAGRADRVQRRRHLAAELRCVSS
jgi:hypothetical protein